MSHDGAEALQASVLARMPTGRDFPITAAELASEIGISERLVGATVQDLISDGWLIGSRCDSGGAGYFLIADLEDLEVGTRHIVSRARSMFARVSQLRKAAAERFPAEALTLFSFDEVDA